MALLTWCQSRIARQIRRNRRHFSNLARALILPPPNAHHGVHFKSRARVGFTTAECTQMVAFPVGVLAGGFLAIPPNFPVITATDAVDAAVEISTSRTPDARISPKIIFCGQGLL